MTAIKSAIGLLLMLSISSLALAGASGKADKTQLFANKDNSVKLTWTVSEPVSLASYQAMVVNTAPTVEISTTDISAGTVQETLTFTAAQVQQWLDNGYRSVILRRHFAPATGGAGFDADVRFTLAGSGLKGMRDGGKFAVVRMQLSFSNQTNLIVVSQQQELVPMLDINYTGAGVLEGRWQIAEPGSSEGLPVYRNLKLSRYNLTKAQHQRVTGPVLPTGKAGTYLLRFCVNSSDATADRSCSAMQVNASYQVVSGSLAPVQPISVTPNNITAGADTAFSWSAVEGAVVYQLQIFQQRGGSEPVFITGMLLPQQSLETPLSELMLEKLKPGKYEWRMQALNAQGQMIGQSQSAVFYYSGKAAQ